MFQSNGVTRRTFLKGAGAGVLALSFSSLEWAEPGAVWSREGATEADYRTWEDLYRKQWRWEKVVKGTHLVNCYPGTCSFNVYVKDGIVWREEQAATYPQVEPGVPDWNPRGCQKGCSHSGMIHSPERILYPLKRAGKRGEGKWKRISWDQALTEVADAIIDAIEEVGCDSLVNEAGTNGLGYVNGNSSNGAAYFTRTVGGTVLDGEALVNDLIPGLIITLGYTFHAGSHDDWIHSELLLITHLNALYTRIPEAHFLTEARYRGTEVVSIAPDYNSSSIHADCYVPIKIGSDAALFLGISKVLIDEGLTDNGFIKEQTDLPLLIRKDSLKFLRAQDLEEGGRSDQFHFLDTKTGKIAKAPRGTLALGAVDPALDGSITVTLKDGNRVEVFPLMRELKETLKEYTPEKAAAKCGANPELIRTLARKMARKRTRILIGTNQGRIYHGDLMGRAQCLPVALTGNFGKRGCGIHAWSVFGFDGGALNAFKRAPGAKGWQELVQQMEEWVNRSRQLDPETTREIALTDLSSSLSKQNGPFPAFFWWYWHCGYEKVFKKKEWNDPSMKRPFGQYMEEALAKGWWDGLARPPKDKPPRVFLVDGGSPLRRQRGGLKLYLEHLWPQLKMIVTVDWRMSKTALHSDIVLPAAFCAYEKVDFRYFVPEVGFLTFNDKAVEPAGESKPEYSMYCLLLKKIGERAKARGLTEYKDALGRVRRYADLYYAYTKGGAHPEGTEESIAAEMVDDSVRAGNLPEGTTLQTLREKGVVRFTGFGNLMAGGLNMATDIKPNESFSPGIWHVGEKKLPWPTLTRRIQFYVDHDWFFEAGEQLPVHKDHPQIGGNYPFRITSGHQRWSIHSVHVINRLLLRTHRGVPFLFVNPDDARRKGVKDHDLVRVFNDFSSFKVNIKLSPATQPGQVIIYHAWEPYQFPEQKSYDILLPGVVKWLHLVGGYGHLRYIPANWSPAQVGDRGVAIDFEKA